MKREINQKKLQTYDLWFVTSFHLPRPYKGMIMIAIGKNWVLLKKEHIYKVDVTYVAEYN